MNCYCYCYCYYYYYFFLWIVPGDYLLWKAFQGRFMHLKPPTDHLPTTYQPATDHLPTTYQPPTDHLPTTYWPATDQLPTSYRPATDHLLTTYWSPTNQPLQYFHFVLINDGRSPNLYQVAFFWLLLLICPRYWNGSKSLHRHSKFQSKRLFLFVIYYCRYWAYSKATCSFTSHVLFWQACRAS